MSRAHAALVTPAAIAQALAGRRGLVVAASPSVKRTLASQHERDVQRLAQADQGAGGEWSVITFVCYIRRFSETRPQRPRPVSWVLHEAGYR